MLQTNLRENLSAIHVVGAITALIAWHYLNWL